MLISMTAIKIRNLTKEFNGFTAVDRISFDVKKGELFGLLGPNGAGKTTTINMLSTLLVPTSGYAKIAGYDVTREKNNVRRNIGIVFQEPALDNKLTGRENLEFHAMMYGMNKHARNKKIAEVLRLVELKDKADVLVENYSGGMKRRLEIARGLIHNPKVLFLDEPTLGLDAQTRRRIWDYIKNLNRKHNITIILTTHYMEEADYLCNRVAIIDHGKIIAMDTPKRLKDNLGGDVITFEMESHDAKFINTISKMGFVKSVKSHDSKLTITVENGEKRIPELIKLAQKNGINVKSVSLHKPSLEDVFLHFTGKTIREKEADQKEKNMQFMMRRFRR